MRGLLLLAFNRNMVCLLHIFVNNKNDLFIKYGIKKQRKKATTTIELDVK